MLVQQFVYQDGLKHIAELDGAGNVLQQYVYAAHVNVPDLIITASSEYRVVTDHLSSVREVVDVGSGAVVEEIKVDEYGNVLSDPNLGLQPFGFAGGLQDNETQLVRFGARDYMPAIGRWTRRDPTLFAPGDGDLYNYVMQDPVTFVDPVGLWPLILMPLKATAEQQGPEIARSFVPSLTKEEATQLSQVEIDAFNASDLSEVNDTIRDLRHPPIRRTGRYDVAG